MSIWISDSGGPALRALMLAAILPLAGCLDTGGTGAMGFRAQGANAAAPLSQIAFYRGAVVVEGPNGYCIDGKSLRRGAGSGFALLTSCAHMVEGSVSRVTPAVITVSVLPFDAKAEQPSAQDMRRSLAPSKALDLIDGDGISLIHLADGGDEGVPGGDARYWRASLLVNGHVVGLAAYGSQGSDVAGRGGRNLLIDMAEHIREASPLRPLGAPNEGLAPVAVDGSPAPNAAQGGLKSVLTGLFRNPV